MLTTMLGKRIFAMAAIQSRGDAFVSVTLRPLGSSAVGIGSAPRRSAHGPIRPGPRSALPILHGGSTSRDASSSALRLATKPLVVCGPSGVGKGTIISRFMEGGGADNSELPAFGFGVSHTTRRPRPGEVDGVHYHFVSRESMLDRIESGSFFVEHAEVHGNLYGTSFRAIFDASHAGPTDGSEIAGGGGRQCLLDIDVEGVRSIKEFQSRQRRETKNGISSGGDALPELDARFVFIAPPSINVLRRRLEGRGTETPEALERRFRNAQTELDYGMEPDNFDAIVVNDDLERACAEFEKIVGEMYVG